MTTMAKLKITAPVEGFRGDVAGLIFRDGSAVADDTADRAALAYCRRRGYTVESLDVEPGDADQTVERPKDYAAKADWVAYAITRGADADDAENATKAELVELYGN